MQIPDAVVYAAITAVGGGWGVVATGVGMLFKGTLVTRREVDTKDSELNRLKDTELVVATQSRDMLAELLPLVKEILEAGRKVAKEKEVQ